MKKIIFLLILILTFQAGKSQNLSDAFRLSNTQINGTARSSGIGNAMGSLGGDLTSLSINPAGIGVFLNNEITVTPSFNFNNSKAIFNQTFKDNSYQLDLNNIGIVFTTGKNNYKKFNFGVSLNKLSNLDQAYYFKNEQSPISFIDDMVYSANYNNLSNNYLNQDITKLNINDWPTKLGWDTYLFDPALDNYGNEIDKRYVAILYQEEKVNQRKSFQNFGETNEVAISGGFNYFHKFYIGVTLGINNTNFNSISRYYENFGDNSFVFTDNYTLNGEGYNLKLGTIYKLTNSFRLGLAFHSPTYYSLNQYNVYSIESFLLNNHYSEGINDYNYNFYTPFKVILSGSLVGKNALISADMELVDYSTMKFKSSYDDLSDLNFLIKDNFKNTLNLRIGGELKASRNLTLRGGYELYENPYRTYNNYEPILTDDISIINYGIGYNTGNFFTDVTYRQIKSKYILNEIQPNFQDINLNNINNKIMFTFGFKF